MCRFTRPGPRKEYFHGQCGAALFFLILFFRGPAYSRSSSILASYINSTGVVSNCTSPCEMYIHIDKYKPSYLGGWVNKTLAVDL